MNKKKLYIYGVPLGRKKTFLNAEQGTAAAQGVLSLGTGEVPSLLFLVNSHHGSRVFYGAPFSLLVSLSLWGLFPSLLLGISSLCPSFRHAFGYYRVGKGFSKAILLPYRGSCRAFLRPYRFLPTTLPFKFTPANISFSLALALSRDRSLTTLLPGSAHILYVRTWWKKYTENNANTWRKNSHFVNFCV